METISVSQVSFNFTQLPATHCRAHHAVDLCTRVTHPALHVHLFSLLVPPPAVFFFCQAQHLKVAFSDL